VVPNKVDLLRQLAERGQRLQRAGLTALIAPSHQLQRRRQSLERVGLDLHARRRERIAHLEGMLRQRDPREVLRRRERSLEECRRRLQRNWQVIASRIETGRLGKDGLRERLVALAGRGVRERASGLQSRAARLSSLAPEQTLKRGYSITLDASGGGIIRGADQARKGQSVNVLLSAGRLEATVDEVIP
jgi:exodeoxyribonuclease VII large subunit